MGPDTARQIPSPTAAIISISHAPSLREVGTAAERRHDNPRWPVRSPADTRAALVLHGECPWHCSTRLAALLVSRNDYQYFRDRTKE